MSAALSILASHDELVRCTNVLVNGSCEGEFLQFAINQEEMRQKWLVSVQECQRLHSALEKAHFEAANLDRKLSHARRLLDEEKKRRRHAEEERNSSERQIALVRDLLFNDGGRNFNDETREKLMFLNNTTLNARHSTTQTKDHYHDKLNTITELDSTGSLLSDLSCFSKSEDDLDRSIILQQNHKKREWKEHRPSGEYAIPNTRRRSALQKAVDLNSSDRIVATTTLVMPKEGAITASSVIEAIPADENVDPQQQQQQQQQQLNQSHNSSRKRRKTPDRHSRSKSSHLEHDLAPTPSAPNKDIISSNSDTDNVFKPSPNIGGFTMTKSTRGHNLMPKTVMKPELCAPCGKRLHFGKAAVKCRDCRAVSHVKCKDLLPLPCIPAGNTPTMRGMSGTIADYTPTTPPMVPSLVVHCINEVELRGMSEQGLYRVNGGSAEVKCLKEKFLKGRGAPNLSEVDVSTICSTLKDFLRSLKEPLITVGLWADFARAVEITDKLDAEAALYQAISELPQPNRDTLAFLILHLQRVSSTPECKMPISNLAKVFGPTLVGYSSQQPSRTSMLTETRNQVAIVESLLLIPSDYWANFVNPEQVSDITTSRTGTLRTTPSTRSTDSLSRKGFFQTPRSSSKMFVRKNKRYFGTPPINTKQIY